jgi:hypothetical protein
VRPGARAVAALGLACGLVGRAAAGDSYALDQARHAASRGFWDQAWEALEPSLRTPAGAEDAAVQALAADIALHRADPAAWAHAADAAALAGDADAAASAALRLDWMRAQLGTLALRCAPAPCGASAEVTLTGADPALLAIRDAAVARLAASGPSPRAVLAPAGQWTIDGVPQVVEAGRTRVVRAAGSRQPGWEVEPALSVVLGSGRLAVPGPGGQIAASWRHGACAAGGQVDAGLGRAIETSGQLSDPKFSFATLGRLGCDTHPRRPLAPGLVLLAGLGHNGGGWHPEGGVALLVRHAPGGDAARPGPALQLGLRWSPDGSSLRFGPTLRIPL